MNASAELYFTVRRLIPLHLLPQASCQRLCEELVIEEAAVGDILFQRGGEDSDWIYLLQGEVGLEADDIVMEQISGGSDAARFPLAHQVPRKVAARALTKLHYIRIDHRRLKLMEHYQDDVLQSDAGESGENPGDWMTKLFKSPVFQRLPASNLHKIVQRLKAVEVSRGDKLIVQGEAGDCLYILHTGRCQVTRRPRPNAREIKLGELQPGDLFGEDALLSGQPRAVDVTMLTDGVVLRLDREDFLSLVAEPVLQKLSFESALGELEQGSVWLDVRDPDSYRRRRLAGSLNIPFFSLRMQLASLQRQRKYILVCDQGGQSQAAAFLLLRFGFEAAVLAGGLANVPPKCLVGEDTGLETAPSEPERTEDEVLDAQPGKDKTVDQRAAEGWAQEVRCLQAELERLRAENEALLHRLKEVEATQAPQGISQGISDAQRALKDLHQTKQALEAEAAALRLRVVELEGVIQQYCEAVQAEGVGETIQALQTELDMVREQADQDVTAMRHEVEEVRQECARLQQALASRDTKPAAALPPDLVAVDPEQLPLQLPEVLPRPLTGRTAPAWWLLVGILLSLAGLGIGLQTEHGRHWLLTWLRREMPEMAPAGLANQSAERTGSKSLPDEDPPVRPEDREDAGSASEALFAQ